MLELYKLTALEDFVEALYRRAGISEPKQLSVHEVSRRLNVWLHYAPVSSRALESANGLRSMFLDSRLPEIKQRMIFFHELCHLLRHYGNQLVMPDLFTEAQENEARCFTYYAAIPFSMIKSLSLPSNRQQAIEYVAFTFNVSLKFAERRLSQIERRVLQGQFEAAASNYQKELFSTNWTPVQTAIYAYYDSASDIAGPSQIVIEADEDTLDSGADFLFSIEGPFSRLELDDLVNYSQAKRILAHDLIFKDGHIGVNFAVLNIKYGRTQRYVLHMKDIEGVIELRSYF
ncbi:hypothetical protein D3C87_1115340 [compost metagenome]